MEMRDFRLERSSMIENIRNRKTVKLLASDEGPDVVRTVRAASAAASWPSVYLASMAARARPPANGALCRISAREQLNLGGHGEPQRLFFLEARIVGGDTSSTVSLFNLNFVIHAFHDPNAEQFDMSVDTSSH